MMSDLEAAKELLEELKNNPNATLSDINVLVSMLSVEDKIAPKGVTHLYTKITLPEDSTIRVIDHTEVAKFMDKSENPDFEVLVGKLIKRENPSASNVEIEKMFADYLY